MSRDFPSTVPMDYALVLRAAKFATLAHDGQRRRYTDEPYTVHLFSVASMVAMHTTDPHVISAALLHDVVEDTPVTVADLRREFSVRVATMVEALTDTPTVKGGLNRAARKAIDRDRIHAADANVHLIKAMDMLDNTTSIVEHDPNFSVVFLREKALLVPMLDKLDPTVKLMLQEYRK
jgi:(p)ppGpp synthase/HD superfamily hydrolase